MRDSRIVYKFVRAGTARFASPAGDLALAAGDVLAIDAGVSYQIAPDPGYEVTRVGFDRRYIIDQLYWLYTGLLPDRAAAKRMLDAIYRAPIHETRLDQPVLDRVCDILDRLDDALSQPLGLEHHAQAMSLSWSLITELGNLHATPPADPGIATHTSVLDLGARRSGPRTEARAVAELLTTEPGTPWTTAELAARVHLSPSQLRRVFTATYGMPPATYLARARAHRMAALLTEHPDLTISEAALHAGWHSRTHATAAFTRHHGVTPTQYRARTRDDA
ncbi:AraC family transcriptional regulator [Leucobacter rhizosphaerae]|uniref:AraC family transcriptional regulator n=1 Tax=Leucobacter rhizosphaerae TaxID=2932245 RepID=A0ABY4FZ22_9MICO|nr:AraC family transcriptional regulator [Leucobacter rhizosphaerae]UOQ61510.1 AraC family transcriptional regulator [Leucobacter rhizosphaerae]